MALRIYKHSGALYQASIIRFGISALPSYLCLVHSFQRKATSTFVTPSLYRVSYIKSVHTSDVADTSVCSHCLVCAPLLSLCLTFYNHELHLLLMPFSSELPPVRGLVASLDVCHGFNEF